MQEMPSGVLGGSRDGAEASSRVAVQVVLPDGCAPPSHVSLSFTPQTAEEFELIVQGCGGPAAFTACADFSFAPVPGGLVHLHRPRDVEFSVVRDPFMDAFDARCMAARAERCPVPDALEDVPF